MSESPHHLQKHNKPAWRVHPVEAVLRLFTDIRAGEGLTVLWLTLNVFLLLTSYYLLKVAREPLILLGGGAEVKSYAAAGQSLLLIGVSAAYGWLSQRVGRMRLIALVSFFFASNLVLFCVLGRLGVPLGIPFYLWVGVFSLTVITQFWSFAADIYTPEQGKRLFPIVGVGSSVGSVAGARVAKSLLPIGPYALMLGAAALLLLCLVVTWRVNKRELAKARLAATSEQTLGNDNGFAMLFRDRYLLAVAALALVLNWVNTTGEYALDRTLVAEAPSKAAALGISSSQYIGDFKANYFAWVNALGVLFQLFAVSRILKHVGVRRALFLMPVVSLGGYGSAALVPVLSVLFVAKVAENTLDYSLQTTSRQALWLITSRDAKYKVKQIIDTFVVRAGDVLSAAVVWVGTSLALSTQHFLFWNVGLIFVWFGVLMVLGREHQRRSEAVDAEV